MTYHFAFLIWLNGVLLGIFITLAWMKFY